MCVSLQGDVWSPVIVSIFSVKKEFMNPFMRIERDGRLRVEEKSKGLTQQWKKMMEGASFVHKRG